MKKNNVMADSVLLWGDPKAKLDNRGHARTVYFLAAVLVVVLVTDLFMNSNFVLSIFVIFAVLFLLFDLFFIRNKTRVDYLYLWGGGIGFAYSFLPKPLANFENVKVFIPWRLIADIRAWQYEGGQGVVISLKKRLKSREDTIDLNCLTMGEANLICTKLNDYRALHMGKNG